MLEALRQFVTGWVAKVLLVLLIGSFALWGTESILSGGDPNTVATVGETKIPVREFLTSYNRNINEVQQQAGRRLTRDEARIFGIEQRALGNVVAWATLDEFARRNGLSLSDKQLSQMIAENPAFQDSTGDFNRQTFQQAVYQAQMRESDFIEAQNASAIRSQLTRSFADGPILPDTFKNALTSYAGEQRVFEYVTITPEAAGAPAEPTPEQLAKQFGDNKATYAAPEYRKISLLSLQPADLAATMQVSDEEVAVDYNTRIASYQVPERRRVQQLVFPDQAAADAAAKALAEGAIFETVVTEAGKTIADTDLGVQAKTTLPTHLQEPAFALDLNTASDVIAGPFGPVIIRVTEINAAATTPLDEVQDDIKKTLALERAADRITGLSEEIEDARAGGSSLTDVADKFDVKARTLTVDARGRTPEGEQITDIANSSEVLRRAFAGQVGEQAPALDIGAAGFIWYDVEEVIAARDRTQDEVADRVRTDWTAAEQARLIDEKAKAIAERLEGGATMLAVAQELDPNGLGEVKKTPPLNRQGTAPGVPRSAVQAGFRGKQGKVLVTDGETAGNQLVMRIAEVNAPEAAIAAGLDAQLRVANEGAADDLLNQMITRLQGDYVVTQNPQAINYALTQGR